MLDGSKILASDFRTFTTGLPLPGSLDGLAAESTGRSVLRVTRGWIDPPGAVVRDEIFQKSIRAGGYGTLPDSDAPPPREPARTLARPVGLKLVACGEGGVIWVAPARLGG